MTREEAISETGKKLHEIINERAEQSGIPPLYYVNDTGHSIQVIFNDPTIENFEVDYDNES